MLTETKTHKQIFIQVTVNSRYHEVNLYLKLLNSITESSYFQKNSMETYTVELQSLEHLWDHEN